jgi:C4-dicarboxylate transporter, DctQ subunit
VTLNRDEASRLVRVGRVAGAVLDRVGDIAMVLGALIILLMMAAITFEVVMRYLFNAPTIWVVDTAAFGLLWVTFLVGPWVTRNHAHIELGLLRQRLQPRASNILQVVTNLLAAGTLGVFCYLVTVATVDAWEAGVLTQGSWIVPRAPFWIIMPIGSLLMALEFGRIALTSQHRLVDGPSSHATGVGV